MISTWEKQSQKERHFYFAKRTFEIGLNLRISTYLWKWPIFKFCSELGIYYVISALNAYKSILRYIIFEMSALKSIQEAIKKEGDASKLVELNLSEIKIVKITP